MIVAAIAANFKYLDRSGMKLVMRVVLRVRCTKVQGTNEIPALARDDLGISSDFGDNGATGGFRVHSSRETKIRGDFPRFAAPARLGNR